MTDNTAGITRTRCPNCNHLSIRRATDTTPYACTNATCAADAQRLHPAEPTTAQRIAASHEALAREIIDPNPGVVYYISWADRIKIGTTRNLRQRLRVLYHDDLLAVERGGPGAERQRHQDFASQLVTGQTEWFHPSAELNAHIAALRAEHGEPIAAAERWGC